MEHLKKTFVRTVDDIQSLKYRQEENTCLQVRMSVILVSTSFSSSVIFFFIPDIKRNHIHTFKIKQLYTQFEECPEKELLI